MVTTVSIRLALGKLAEMICGTRPRLIRVTARTDESRRIYSAAIPWEYRDEVCSFLSERLDTEILSCSIRIRPKGLSSIENGFTSRLPRTNLGVAGGQPRSPRVLYLCSHSSPGSGRSSA